MTKDNSYADLARRIVKVCDEFGAPVRMAGEPVIGPTFLRFPIEPGKGVSCRKVEALAPDMQSRLGLDRAPFIHMANGHQVIDVQRPDRQVVPFESVRSQLGSIDPRRGSARVPIGVDLEGRLACANLGDPSHAHILVAGTTGSGKSEWMRSALAGLIVTNTPETLRLVLIDPKRNAFAPFKNSPFLLTPGALVYPDEQDVCDVLDLLIDEMESRYRMLEEARVPDIGALTARCPRIVCACDEYADLVSRGKKEKEAIERGLSRLGAKARAAGIHLILATQHPSRKIIEGALDSNMPCRVALRVGKALESRMILTASGAENLLGNGDLLFRDIGDPRRYQAVLLSEAERNSIPHNGGR